MVSAYHLVVTAYGCWLPNDPRGSTSHQICSDVIRELGELHYGRKRIQPASRDLRAFYARATGVLQHERMEFSVEDRAAIADAFGAVIREQGYTCYALAIMRDHAHLCMRKSKHQAEEMIARLQEGSRAILVDRRHRIPHHPVWGGPGWRVYLNSADDIWRTVDYIAKNPIRTGWPAQRFPFVTADDGWTSPQVRLASLTTPRNT